MRAGLYLALIATALACATTAGATGGVPPLLFPVVGTVTYTNDFGQQRPGGPHQGNDLVAKKRAPLVAVEDGTIEYWTTSPGAGCMLYLHGDSGTMYEYIHLNNDLTAGNDNKGKCVQGVAYSVADQARVAAGEQIGYVGDSGDANGIHPHLHFEVHPKGGKAVSPYPFLQKAAHLLVTAPPSGSRFTLRLIGTVVSSDSEQLTITVTSLTAWPSHLKLAKVDRVLTLTIPAVAAAGGPSFVPGEQLVAWTLPTLGTVEALTGAPGALSLDRSLPL
jgi:Peptidase family M23